MKAPRIAWTWFRVVAWTALALILYLIYRASESLGCWVTDKSEQAEQDWIEAKHQ